MSFRIVVYGGILYCWKEVRSDRELSRFFLETRFVFGSLRRIGGLKCRVRGWVFFFGYRSGLGSFYRSLSFFRSLGKRLGFR